MNNSGFLYHGVGINIVMVKFYSPKWLFLRYLYFSPSPVIKPSHWSVVLAGACPGVGGLTNALTCQVIRYLTSLRCYSVRVHSGNHDVTNEISPNLYSFLVKKGIFMAFNNNKNYVTLLVMLDQGLCFISTD